MVTSGVSQAPHPGQWRMREARDCAVRPPRLGWALDTLRSSRVPRNESPFFWLQLLQLLDARQIVPIVGQDLVRVDTESGQKPLTAVLAKQVEALLEVPAGASESPTLNDVACRYLDARGRDQIADLYAAVKHVLSEYEVAVPPALRALASIDAISLYVTTAFDGMLQRAIDETRFGGHRRTRAFAYSPERVEDLPAPIADMDGPVVYHLFGRASAVPDYAVTDEDTLEFVHSLQSEQRRPNLLLDELRSRSLLLIGSGFPDWLTRFFVRIAKRERLLLARSKADVVADERVRNDTELVAFLQHFSAQTRIFSGSAEEFVMELAERWAAHQQKATDSEPRDAQTLAVEPHAIFVSYASEDIDAAARLADALRAARLPVWFDRRVLEAGDQYERRIRDDIRRCSLFVPVLSHHVLTTGRRFFFREWSIAADTSLEYGHGRKFIVPCRIDDVPRDAPQIPLAIRDTHIADVTDDASLAAFVSVVRDLYRRYQLTGAEM